MSGHSERRAAFNESDAAINRKVHKGLRPPAPADLYWR
ncbi:triose-phosphate isomerase [Klebsiella pneumoniae]|nr:triose-phosphate isomerase [Klebsiella pneumoniae]